ncbi:MAG: hypothetical protein JSU86_02020 [Phycisphaerales bacterium]|nr:MAG: hypothetical protein JSU86_02020 [Phycisphaerales bacterium]
MLEEGFPIREQLSELAVEVSHLVRPAEGIRRFREMIQKWGVEADQWVVKKEEWERRRNEHFGKAASGDPSLTNYGAGPPERDWVWDVYVIRPPYEQREIRAWTPPGLASKCCPEDYSLIPLPKRELSPAEKYTLLAAIRDHFLDKGVKPIGQPNGVLEGFAYSLLVKAVPAFHIEDVPVLKEFLAEVRLDIGPPETDLPKPTTSVEPRGDRQHHVDLPPAVEKAFSAYQIAEKHMNPPPETDSEAYEWLKENPQRIESYTLPILDTWTRQVRDARRAKGIQKHKPRVGRATGASIISQRDTSLPRRDNG